MQYVLHGASMQTPLISIGVSESMKTNNSCTMWLLAIISSVKCMFELENQQHLTYVAATKMCLYKTY